ETCKALLDRMALPFPGTKEAIAAKRNVETALRNEKAHAVKVTADAIRIAQSSEHTEEWLTVREAAEFLGLRKTSSIYEHINRGTLTTATQESGTWLIERQEIEAWAARRNGRLV